MSSNHQTQSSSRPPLKPIVLNAPPPKPRPVAPTMINKKKKTSTNFVMSEPITRWGPINFKGFIGILKNYDLLVKEGADLERAGTRPSPKFGTITQNLIYEDGVSKLLRVIFESEDDATASIKIAIQRAFGQFSAVVKNHIKNKDGTIVTIGYDCTKAICKKRDKTKVDKCEKCHWKAVLKVMGPKDFQFVSIGVLEAHTPKCFEGASNNYTGLLEHLSKTLGEHGKELSDFNSFNEDYKRKTCQAVPKYRVNRYINYKKRKAVQTSDDNYIDIYKASEGHRTDLEPEDMALIGAFMSIKKEIKEFEYDCVISEEGKLVSIMCLWPSQKEALLNFFDLVFIDATYNINNRSFNALNVVIVDNHYRSVLAATAIARCEVTESYSSLLRFIWERVKPRRLPLCMISDSAFQIHNAMSKTFPYCRHIYCGFHLLKDDNLFPKHCTLTPEKKKEIKGYARAMLTSNSLYQVESEAYKLYEYEESLSGVDDAPLKQKVLKIIGNGLNGSKPLQDVFTASSIASSRVESMNSVIKGFGMDTSKSLLENIKLLKELSIYQSHFNYYVDRKKWKYAKDEDFKKCLDEDVLSGITKEVLERMYNQFLLAHDGKYDVRKVGDVYEVRFKCGDPSRVYYPYTVKSDGKNYFCQCIIPSGYACRHIFAVTEHLGFEQKVTLGTINSRFYLDQETVDFADVNLKGKQLIIETIYNKNARYGSLFTERPSEDVSKNISNPKIDIDSIFEQDLTYSRVIKPGAKEQVRRVFKHPKSSSSPILEEPEDDVDIGVDPSSGDEDWMSTCEIPEEETIYAVPVPPEKAHCASMGGTASDIFRINKIIDEEMSSLEKLEMSDLRANAILHYRGAIEKIDREHLLESTRESIRIELTSECAKRNKQKAPKSEPEIIVIDADDDDD